MAQPLTIAVPATTLQSLLALARAGITPRLPWNESHERMIHAAMEARKEALQAIENELETLLNLKP